jgi:hypothetical protein
MNRIETLESMPRRSLLLSSRVKRTPTGCICHFLRQNWKLPHRAKAGQAV